MNSNPDDLAGQLRKYETQLSSLNSYIKELKDRATELGTDKEQFAIDLLEAENNVRYYEGEIARVKEQMRSSTRGPRLQAGADAILPKTVKQGVGSLIFSSISFVAGAILGSMMKSRRGGKDTREEKRDG